ncbi:MAG: polysaccharide deacetylase family protein [Sarcina sp.]
MIKKKIIGYLAIAAILTGGVGASSALAKTNNTNSNNNHILLAQHTANSGNQAVVINGSSKLVLYSTTSKNSSIKSYLSVGQMLTINSNDNGFYNVTVHETGSTGYISATDLQKISSGINDQFNPMNTKGQVINVSNRVNLRNNPSMSSSVINTLTNKTNLKILGKQGDWYKVSTGSQTGYMYGLYVGSNSSSSGIATNSSSNANVTKPSTSTATKPSSNANITKPSTSTVTKPSSNANVTKPSTSTVTKPSSNANVTKPSTSTATKPSSNANVTKPSTSTATKPDSNVNTTKPTPVGTSNSAIVPGNNIIYSAQSYAVPANQVRQMVNGNYKGGGKQVFLTFDDGPSATYTPQVLSILKQNGVHGTFFVVGSQLQSSNDKNILKQEIMDGNAIGNHSYSHNYSTLYPSNSINVNSFMNEFNKTESAMQGVLGSNFDSKVVRMPGGENSRQYYHDKNLSSLQNAFSKDGITSIDWNAENGDATGKTYTPQQLVQNAINQSKGKNQVVLLMHDVKGSTVKALPQIIQYYKSQGYTFKVISNSN